jgi:hypothetical protein
MKTYPNDPINPTPIAGGDNYVVSANIITTTVPGLTKREYFAAIAMQGLISNSLSGRGPNGCAEDSVKFADALIKELNK